MAEYRVTWEINITADSPQGAAIEAVKMQQDPFSEAIHFTVLNEGTNEIVEVDLLTEEPEHPWE